MAVSSCSVSGRLGHHCTASESCGFHNNHSGIDSAVGFGIDGDPTRTSPPPLSQRRANVRRDSMAKPPVAVNGPKCPPRMAEMA
jgi:hypothetical protein